MLVESPIIKQQGNIKDYLGVDPPPFFSAHPTVSHELLHRIGYLLLNFCFLRWNTIADAECSTGTIVAKQALKEFTPTEAVLFASTLASL